MQYYDFTMQVIDELANLIECTYNDASAIVECQELLMSQCFRDNMSVSETAKLIDQKSKVS